MRTKRINLWIDCVADVKGPSIAPVMLADSEK
jgi:hypothetical protein